MSAGIDIRQAIIDAGGTKVTQFIVEAFQVDGAGDILATGTTQLELLERQSDGTLEVYDFDAGVRDFVASSPTDRDLAMTHQQAAGANTGIWTAVLDQHAVNAMDLRGIYYLRVTNTGASPKTQVRKFQFGDVDGDGFAFMQIAGTDAADAYGTAIEANSVTRAANIQDTVTQEATDLTTLANTIFDSQVVHTTTISNALSTGGNPPVTVTLTAGVASGVKAGQVVVIAHDLGGKSVWRATADSAGTTIVLQGASEGVAGVTIGDTVYVLSASNLTELISTGNAAAATAVTNSDLAAARALTAANNAVAVREQSVRLRGAITSVSGVIPGVYTVSLNIGSSTIGTFDGYVAYVHSASGNYKGGPHTIEDNADGEGVVWISQPGYVVGDIITIAKATTDASAVVTAINADATQTTARTNASTAVTQTAEAAIIAAVTAAFEAIDADGYDLVEALRLLLAILAGEVTATATTATFRAVDDSKDRVTATVTAAGARTSVTTDAS